jgi:hypothetical protein
MLIDNQGILMLLFVHSLEEYNPFITSCICNKFYIISSTTEDNHDIQTRTSLSDVINRN